MKKQSNQNESAISHLYKSMRISSESLVYNEKWGF